ncbi:ClpP/crotonase-like domain-containing protein [Aspergillus pseudoustus]|uniref:ClpP/crotonase-like domain-containing protein n=1 Tax=Aspergillus pseudoustus TaxID=1810923 RepID=A0ABR4JMA2_9EURO
MPSTYTHLIFEVHDQIGVIKLNRPKYLNAWNETLLHDMVAAFRELDGHPDTVFTVLTGEGRFFSAGADIKAGLAVPPADSTAAQKKLWYMRKFSSEMELFRSMIDHRKVFVLALNGPAVGGGAAWFEGIADIVLAAAGSYLQVPFNSLGLVPEFGAARTFAQSMGVRRANDFLMFGRKCSVEEMESWGLVNRVFPADGFQGHVREFLLEQLRVNDGKSMMETKSLQNAPLRDGRIVAMFDAAHALSERFVDGAPYERFRKKTEELASNSGSRRVKAKSSL